MLNTIEAEATLENCRALINQIIAGLSAEEPFVNVSSAAELLFYLERAASALKKSVSWPAPGSEDTELGVLMELEVGHGETEVYAGIQA